jgi:hypothetical protein
MKINKMENRVRDILINHPTARLDDHELFLKYFTTYYDKEFNTESFMRHKLNFESVARIRRRVINAYPELQDSIANVVRVRKEMSRSLRKVYS